MLPRRHSALGVWLAGAAALAACARGDESPGQDAPASTPNVVTTSATEYAFQAPDTIPAGWTTLRLANLGTEIHYGHVIRLDSGRTVPELVEAYAHAIRTSGPRPKWVTRFGGPGGTAPGDTSSVTQFLEPGSYVWMCPIEDMTGAPHFGKGEHKAFVVHGAGPGGTDRAAAPQADIVVRLLDFSFEVDSSLPAGRRTVRVHNAGVEPHDLVLLKLAPGKTLADAATWLNPEMARRDQPNQPPPSLDALATGMGGIAAIAPGMDSYFDTELTPGEYVLLCMATAPDGRSHLEHGMVRQLRVP